jgi:uncharacterized membrane protein
VVADVGHGGGDVRVLDGQDVALMLNLVALVLTAVSFDALVALLPKLVSWAISFLTVCIVWINHHRIFDMFKGINIQLFWLNVQMLFWVCFIPFPTALIGDYPANPLAVALYGFVMFCTGASFVATRYYGLRNPGLLKETVSQSSARKGMVFAFFFGPVLYLAGAALAWVSTWASFAMYLLIAVYFAFSFVIVHAGETQRAEQ